MAIDTEYLIEALKASAKEGVHNGLLVVQKKAQSNAPVRNIFPRPNRSRRALTVEETLSIARATGDFGHSWSQMARGGPPKTMTVSQAKQAGFLVTATHPGGYRNRRGQKLVKTGKKGYFSTIGQTISGRPNSFAPVIRTPHGRIGGVELRRWSASSGGLEAKTVRAATGPVMKVEDLLSARGRYEVRTGRAVVGAGQLTVGGRLREGIKIEGPFEGTNEVYGFVSAYASDPGRTPPHNYARDQEFGSRHNAAHPFLRPALRSSAESVRGGLRSAVAKAFKGGSRPARSSRAEMPYVVEVSVKFPSTRALRTISAGIARDLTSTGVE